MQTLHAWLKPGIWGAVVGSVLTMIVGFSWGGWTTHSTANQEGIKRADAAVTATLVPICLAQEKVDAEKGKKLGELKALTASYEQTEFVMKTGWATFPGKTTPTEMWQRPARRPSSRPLLPSKPQTPRWHIIAACSAAHQAAGRGREQDGVDLAGSRCLLLSPGHLISVTRFMRPRLPTRRGS